MDTLRKRQKPFLNSAFYMCSFN